jgi:hypothetical protein
MIGRPCSERFEGVDQSIHIHDRTRQVEDIEGSTHTAREGLARTRRALVNPRVDDPTRIRFQATASDSRTSHAPVEANQRWRVHAVDLVSLQVRLDTPAHLS